MQLSLAKKASPKGTCPRSDGNRSKGVRSRTQSVSETPSVNWEVGGRSFVSQLASFDLVAFQLGHLVFSFANRIVPRDEQLR
jgi:hypothetical protein